MFEILDQQYRIDNDGQVDKAFDDSIRDGGIIVEEGMVLGRNFHRFKITGASVSSVNGPAGDKGQNFWDGTYRVILDRGLILDRVYVQDRSGRGAQEESVIPTGEKVCIQWLSKGGVKIPLISNGNTTVYFEKQLSGKNTLLDPGERILRAAKAAEPKIDVPFGSNQYDDPATSPDADGNYDENNKKVVKYPGGELFLDKFGRVMQTSRQEDFEVLVTNGKIDSGQNDVSALKTAVEQNTYYDAVLNDESQPINPKEPFAPRPLNLVQYQPVEKVTSVKGDNDPNAKIRVGLLPRFDKWKFVPISIRSRGTSSDAISEVSGEVHSVHQLRGQTKVTGTVYTSGGYVRTITDMGDVKEFVPRHVNQRIVGTVLKDIGGSYDLRLKTNYTDTTNIVHVEYLSDGTIRHRSGSVFEQVTLPNGSLEIYVGGSQSTAKVTLKATAAGALEVTTEGNVTINAAGNVEVSATGNATVSAAQITLASGDAAAWAPCILPNCLLTGAPQGGIPAGITKLKGA